MLGQLLDAPLHVWPHILADLVTWLAYTSIPVMILIALRRQRSQIPHPFLWVMFSLFILTCGITHLLDVIVYWWPAYRLLGLFKVLTALISAATAIALLPMLPRLFHLKTPKEVDEAIQGTANRLEEARQKELSEREFITQTVVEASGVGYWDWRPMAEACFYSASFKAMFGYSDDEWPNDTKFWERVIVAEDVPVIEQALAAHFGSHGERPFDVRVRYRHKAGHVVHVISRGKVIQWGEGDEAVRMVGCHINVTPLVEVEQQLRNRNEQLELVAQGISPGIWDWNREEGKDWWSPRFYELLGYADRECGCGSEVFLHQLLHPDDLERTKAALQAHFYEQAPYKLDIRMRCKDGKYRWFETSGQAKCDESGEPVRMVGSLIDINARKQLERRNEESIAILSGQNDRLLNFAHIVSHNLRSNTGNMMALLEMYAIEDEDTRQQIMEHFSKSAKQLFETVDHLSEVVKIQTDINRKRVLLQFDEIMDKVLSSLRGELEAAQAHVEMDFSAAPQINYVPSYLESICLNLTSNALKYRDPGRILHLVIRTRMEEGCTVLEFEDNGRGLDLARYGKKLFGLYKTFHNNADARGVGLFLVKNQVQALGGSISVASTPGKGSKFTITF